MNRQPVAPERIVLRPFEAWDKGWCLLTAGDFAAKQFNSMTVSWGFFGTIWGRPMAICVVRPQRHTYPFTESSDSFTLSAFAEEHRPTLKVLGSRSGRDMDKINDSGFTPIAAAQVASPAYAEAELVIECRKVYFQDIDPAHFLADYIADCYHNDYHRMYFGEVIAAGATPKYLAE